MFRSKALQIVRRFCSETTYGQRGEKCINQVTLLGRVGQNPTIRGENSTFVTFSMATNEYFRSSNDPSNEWRQITSWHNVVVFKPGLRDAVTNYCRKGDRIHVSGRLSYRKYEDDNDKVVTISNVIADNVIFFRQDKQLDADDDNYVDEGLK